MISKKKKVIALVLALLLTFTSLAAIASSASAASGDFVYCKNDANWSNVYCYMWNSSTKANNAQWPGVKMTEKESGIFSYSVSGDFDMIIFNNGEKTQTGDMSYPGHGKLYNNKAESWTDYSNTDPTSSGGANPNPTQAQTPTQPQGSAGMIYCKNSAGWSNVTVYMWNSKTDATNAGWPGVAMTNTVDDVWSYAYNGSFTHAIFSIGGQSKTADLTFPGDGYIYDNKDDKWDIYDTSPLRVLSFAADLKSPQYEDMDITFTTSASGTGIVNYSYFVTDSNGNETMIRDYSKDSSAIWHPTQTGKYTVTVKMFDEAGIENSRKMSYEIISMDSVAKPIIKSVSPANNSDLSLSDGADITVKAGGGNTGTNLLFYKFEIYDQNSTLMNVPYYTLNNTYSFKPTEKGVYTVNVYVQSSDNSVAKKTLQYEFGSATPLPDVSLASFNKVSGEYALNTEVTFKAVATSGTAPYQYSFTVNGTTVQDYSSLNTFAYTPKSAGVYTVVATVKDSTGKTSSKSIIFTIDESASIKGDADNNGVFNINDPTIVQKYLAKMIPASAVNMKNADVNGDGEVNIVDATLMQKKLCSFDIPW